MACLECAGTLLTWLTRTNHRLVLTLVCWPTRVMVMQITRKITRRAMVRFSQQELGMLWKASADRGLVRVRDHIGYVMDMREDALSARDSMSDFDGQGF